MNNEANTPIYISKPTARSLWQAYRLYPDRLEIQSWVLLHTLVIPLNEINDIWVSRPPIIAESFRGKGFWAGLALKIDLADLFLHVGLHTKSGLIRHIHFTPDDPHAFVAAYHSILKKDAYVS